ncbi:hypothetical protein [Streptosporangium sp. NPDC023615]|uniref:hypothetical protein n=1 Tax=Streptosporangium sp. NPDC023615 TaxID=3154794 RepID=UPI003428A7A7
MAAALTGRLFYDAANRCLTITDAGDPEPGTSVIPVWPSGTRPVIEAGKHGVDLPGDGPVLLEGESIELGGGYVDWEAHPPSGLKIPNACIPDLANSMIFQLHPKQPMV